MQLVRIFLLVLLPSIGFSAWAQSEIYFSTAGYDSLRQSALRENKLLFIDFRAVWCRPCIEMEQKTFKDSALAAFVNRQFVPFKTDIDYPEGDSLKKRFTVYQYPTILILNPDTEEVVLRLVGFKPPHILFEDLRAMRRPERYPER